MEEKIIGFIQKHNLIDVDDNIIIGLSGGPDSVFLLHILKKLESEYNLKIVAVHINHSIREEAVNDELFSRKLAEDLKIEFQSFKVDVPKYALENKLSVEDAGRKVRYNIFREVATKIKGSSKIAVGHHKDDLAETIIMNFIRGSGSNGLIGIREQNGNIIRPILCVKKDELLEYLNINDISYVIDKTNDENDYKRNKVRNELIPYIKGEYNPNIINSLWNMSSILKEEIDFIKEYTNNLNLIKRVDGGYYILIKEITQQHKAIQRAIIFEAYEKLNGNRKDLSYENVEVILELLKKENSSFEIKNYRIYNYNKKICFINKENNFEHKRISFKVGESVKFNDYIIKSELVNNENIVFSNNTAYFNLEILNQELYFRNRENGDVIKLENFTKKVKNILIDKKIDRYIRNKIPILASDDEIFWILGIKRSGFYKIDAELKKVLKISFERIKDE